MKRGNTTASEVLDTLVEHSYHGWHSMSEEYLAFVNDWLENT
jgi:hypothetical protein